MLKTLITMVRGRTAQIAEEFGDQNALLLLDQQMRDAAKALDRAKRALAVANAQQGEEEQRLNATRVRIANLETRAVAAIDSGREDLAAEAAEAIAALEAERDASLTATALFTAEIAKLKGHVLQQQMRFSQLERGRRIARAAEAVRVARRGRVEGAPIFAGTLSEAETTLARLREHQIEADATETALDAIDAVTGPVAVATELAAEGFGSGLKPSAAHVLARLRERADPVLHHSHSWIVFTYVSFVAALAMVVSGIVLMPLDLAMKGYLAMGVAMLIQSCITLTKTIRDNDEAGKLVSRLEDAKTERLLMDVAKGQP